MGSTRVLPVPGRARAQAHGSNTTPPAVQFHHARIVSGEKLHRGAKYIFRVLSHLHDGTERLVLHRTYASASVASQPSERLASSSMTMYFLAEAFFYLSCLWFSAKGPCVPSDAPAAPVFWSWCLRQFLAAQYFCHLSYVCSLSCCCRHRRARCMASARWRILANQLLPLPISYSDSCSVPFPFHSLSPLLPAAPDPVGVSHTQEMWFPQSRHAAAFLLRLLMTPLCADPTLNRTCSPFALFKSPMCTSYKLDVVALILPLNFGYFC